MRVTGRHLFFVHDNRYVIVYMDGYELSRWFVPDEFLSPNGTERNVSIGESEEKRIEIGEMKYYFKNIKSQELISAYYETQAMNWMYNNL